MTWLRVLTALGILTLAAAALLVFARCTAPSRGEHAAGAAPPDVREDAEGSGLFPRMGGDG
ncbi:hypothetical protein ACIG0C_35780 [Kitasatospora aureofaciens]|uniref:Uncharacterized protein n=1 Tax=Kitasatospora aureofaciens TaxID=1894 RepID=A0A1E7NEW1_KITAU|nr:hypothetical protein [Kitasatospora aureofaciens]QEV03146.1 hypothetical protein CP971_31500 [Streptomyces viridifaciens]OEV39240.1 hypothetical protein HS99_0000505 [Kitasatospora aureofaciens]UKZ09804.1 hypothetical protein BOQ63_038470 [Streptomyces viridifaciens]GGU88523.1 hypothetical protein GCM10010502_46660 [Kitasatospora aureofaciens]HJD82372.1 hypothetical protein [Kitasatospora aureofaciens]